MVTIAALGREQIGDSPLQHLFVDHRASGKSIGAGEPEEDKYHQPSQEV
jgi:hypothetical protein